MSDMLNCLLLLTAVCTYQDAVPEPPAAPDAPAQDAPAALPETTPDNVRAFLDEAQARLYDPQASGLQGLSFDLPYDMPPLGSLGVIHVEWAKGAEPIATMTLTEGLELPPQIPAEALEAQAVQQGKQFLGSMLNRPIGSLLEAGVATMGGVRDGLVAVNYAAPDAAAQGIVSQAYLFDEDNMLQRSVAEIEAPGPMGEMKVSMTQAFSWKPADGAADKLIVDSQVIDMDFGFMQQKTTASFGYRQLGEILLLVRTSTVSELPAMMGGGEQTQVLEARNLVVNGAAVANPEPAPAPADTPTEAPTDTGEPAPEGG
jgi:hypothetical protein